MNKQKPKIFLSYAHEDIGMAKRIYRDLKRYGLKVWIDCESLLPGQNWKITIQKTIKQSQYYLLLLSSYSITKRGFIPKEMKIAYEMLEQCSEDNIHLIPVRLNECEPALKISDIHYIDLFPESAYQNGLKKILLVVSHGTALLRNKPAKLSRTDINNMTLRHDFFDKSINPQSKGFLHNYKKQILEGDKVVFDEETGLMWQQSGISKDMVFQDAKKYINELNKRQFAGFNDWRLPTLEEAMSLMEPEQKNDRYINPIFDREQRWIWTADQVPGGSQAAWVVDFGYGGCGWFGFSYSYYCVRAVRSAQSAKAD